MNEYLSDLSSYRQPLGREDRSPREESNFRSYGDRHSISEREEIKLVNIHINLTNIYQVMPRDFSYIQHAHLSPILRIQVIKLKHLSDKYSALYGSIIPCFSLVFGYFINNFSNETPYDYDHLSNIALIFFGLFFLLSMLLAIGYYFHSTLSNLLFSKIDSYIRFKLYSSILIQEYAYLKKIINLSSLFADSISVSNAIIKGRGGITLGISGLLTGLLIALIYSYRMALVMLCGIPLLIVFLYLYHMLSVKLSDFNYENEGLPFSLPFQSIISTIISHSSESIESNRYKSSMNNIIHNRNHVDNSIILIHSLIIFFYIIIVFGIGLWYGTKLIIDGIEFSTFIIVMISFGIGSILGIYAFLSYENIFHSESSAIRLCDLIDRQPNLRPPDLEMSQNIRLQGFIEFVHVTFSHPEHPDNILLHDFSMTVQAGETVAVVGDGNRAIIQLLERLYEPKAGSLCIDKVPIHNLDLLSLRSQIGLIERIPIIIGSRIFDAITYTNTHSSSATVEKAALEAHIHSYISTLPAGYDSSIEELSLSNGLKQQLCFARELLKKPAILLLDEPTLYLDTRCAREIHSVISEIAKKQTTLIVTNHVSTLPKVDRIVVLVNGKVKEEGTHEDLLNRSGSIYSSLLARESC